jgi:hypothetical protein
MPVLRNNVNNQVAEFQNVDKITENVEFNDLQAPRG